DQGLKRLRGLAKLKVLHLRDETIGDETLVALEGMSQLSLLGLPIARVTQGAVERFQRARPGVRIMRGKVYGELRGQVGQSLARRRLLREGFKGRLRLAWRCLVGLS